MEIILFVILLAALCVYARLPVFECTFGLILLLPPAVYLLSLASAEPTRATYIFAAIAIAALANTINKKRLNSEQDFDTRSELLPILVWIASFSFFQYLCLLWPDFYQLGERLRDYALISSVVNSPITAEEPWMAGTSLNYYLYWYRLGHTFHSLFNLPIWQVYHQLQAFTYSLFFTAAFALFRRGAKFSIFGSLCGAVLIAVGSNVEGVRHFFTGDNNWWGPSRVIQGAIDEFPAWSFLLGDLHPHYLNLPLLPFLACIALRSFNLFGTALTRALYLFAFLALGAVWVYNSNAWDLPALMLLATFVFLIFIFSCPRAQLGEIIRSDPGFEPVFETKNLLIFGSMAYLVVSFVFSSLNILPGEMPLRWVTETIGHTKTLELLRHWGMPLGLIAVATVFSFNDWRWSCASGLALFVSLTRQDALWSLLVLFTLNTARLFMERRSERTQMPKLADAIFEGFGVLALFLVIFPEFLFFDDSYGGDIERMNTIFKAYSAAWLPMHFFAFWRLRNVALARLPQTAWELKFPATAVFSVIFVGFFFKTIDLRESKGSIIEPRLQGLSDIERRYTGAATTIQALAKLRPGIVLEAQGPAYDFTTHVATLSSQPSYLGWVNHVNLLSRDYAETSRRAQATDSIYKEPDCATKRQLAQKEGITYIVLGPLERKAYPDIKPEYFTCLREIIRRDSYLVYQVQ
ncbi:MAG: hypothetical protein K1X79_03735 [Oligoflexia bacterium]|nr:hypothetical protein [Oligoflexia bacterium]